MTRVICALDDSPASRAAVESAVEHCRRQGGELVLVGIVRTSPFDPPQPSYGEVARRYAGVQHELARAAATAKEAGLSPRVSLRAGKPAAELLREAEASQADEVFVAGKRSPLAAALAGRPAVEVVRVRVAGAPRATVERELARAA